MFVSTGFTPKRVEVESEDQNFGTNSEIWGRKSDAMPADFTFGLFGAIFGPATIGTTSGGNGISIFPNGFLVSGVYNFGARTYYFTASR